MRGHFPDDPQDRFPLAWDAFGAEIWPGDATVVYEGRELVEESFREEMLRLARTAPLTLARAMGLCIKRYEREETYEQ